jgi:photosystem II stability/assembly factor-like uncharacterized protein
MKKKSIYAILFFTFLIVLGLNNSFSQNVWEKANGPYAYRLLSVFSPSGSNLFTSSLGTGIFRSTNDGDNWTKMNTTFSDTIMSMYVSTGGAIFAGTSSSIFRSTNNGTNWNKLSDTISPYCITANAAGNIFVGSDVGMYKSTDNGNTWIRMNQNNRMIFSISIDSKDGSIYIAYLEID